ncbi:MAG: F0F1 ATP synthase subunit alpha [Oscillospiraceae bacterium]|nr:F0F1 ATP synthase subunit alpha [Oscillospiraceae bacterium]
MQFHFVLINFLLLALIIFLFARKMIVRIFRDRRANINRELDIAQELEAMEPPQFEDPTFELGSSIDPKVAEELAQSEDRIIQIKNFGQRECSEIHRHMISEVKVKYLKVLREKITELYTSEPYRSRLEVKYEHIADEILSMVRLTDGDMAYLKRHNVLYVTLTSAYPLENSLVKRIGDSVTEKLDKVCGKPSYWVLTDPSLIAGFRLRIGDTIYDGTVAEELYQFEQDIMNEPVADDNTAEDVYKVFKYMTDYLDPHIRSYQVGRVIQISDGICWMDGLADIMYGEVVQFDCGELGMVLDIQPDRIGCVIFGEYSSIDSGSRVRRAGRIASVPVGDALLGRVVDAIGKPIDGRGHIAASDKRPIEFHSPAILDRAPVNEPLHTGIKAIDALVPIGKGQRELIIGDRQTGKTSIALDTIINQKGKGTVCIYVAIGQKETSVAEFKDRLEQHGAMDYTIIVTANASGSAATQYIAPFSGTAIAEYFMYEGRDVLIIYDDLSKHAVAYRELSLLLHRPSGREAYPGDIFYLHSRLLERSAHLSEEFGGGSITALPIIETLAGDISAYIPTNVISITDGQIFLESELFHEGQRPAINVGLSVSRVGGAAQTKLMKQMASSLRTKLAQYRELADFTQFGADVDEDTKMILNNGAHLMEALKQGRYQPLEDWQQALLLFTVSEGYADDIPVSNMVSFEKGLFSYFEKHCSNIISELKTGAKASDALIEQIKTAVSHYCERN